MKFLNAYTYGFCEKRGFTQGTAWKHSLRLLYPEFAGEDQNGYCTWGKPANRLLRQFSQRYGDRNGNGKSFPAEE